MIAALKQSGKSKLEMWQKCKLVGRDHEYRSFYALFCLDAHNNFPVFTHRTARMRVSAAAQRS